jgi:hypothetical protein
VMDAAVETPTAVEPVTAFFAHGAAGREERYGGGREVPLGEDLIESGLRQESAQCRGATRW